MKKLAICLVFLSVFVFTAAKLKHYKIIRHKHDNYRKHTHDYTEFIEILKTVEKMDKKERVEYAKWWHDTDPHVGVKLRPLNYAFQGGAGSDPQPQGAQRVDTWTDGQADHQHGEYVRHTHDYGVRHNTHRHYWHEHRESIGNGQTKVILENHKHSLDHPGFRAGTDWGKLDYTLIEFNGETTTIISGGHTHGKQPDDPIYKTEWTTSQYKKHHDDNEAHDGVDEVSDIEGRQNYGSVGNMFLPEGHPWYERSKPQSPQE